KTYGAQIAVLMEYDGKKFSYESRPHLLQNYGDSASQNKFGPGNFVTDTDSQDTPPSSSIASAVATSENSTENNSDDSTEEGTGTEYSVVGEGLGSEAVGDANNRAQSEPQHHVPTSRPIQITLQQLAEMELLANDFFGD